MIASVTPHNEDDAKYAKACEDIMNAIVIPKVHRATLLYGESLIEHLYKSGKHDLLMDAMEGKLDVSKVRE